MKGLIKKLGKQTTIKEDFGKLLLDLGKLIFGSIFLGGILRTEVSQSLLLFLGFIGAGLACVVGLFLTIKNKSNRDRKKPQNNRS